MKLRKYKNNYDLSTVIEIHLSNEEMHRIVALSGDMTNTSEVLYILRKLAEEQEKGKNDE